MIKKANIIYGTLKECVNEIWNMIDFDNMKFPDFDYAAWVDEDITEEDIDEAVKKNDASLIGDSWYGCRQNDDFDPDTINIIFGHYGGGGFCGMEIYEEDDIYKQEIIASIINSTCDELGEDEYTVFEIMKGETP